MSASAAAEASPVLTERGVVTTITLNRPEKRNALNLALLSALEATLVEIARDASVRAVGTFDHIHFTEVVNSVVNVALLAALCGDSGGNVTA